MVVSTVVSAARARDAGAAAAPAGRRSGRRAGPGPEPGAAPPREAKIFTERLQREAERLVEALNDGALLTKISLSGGVATFPWDAQTPGDLLREADNALYAAKRAGRNRIYFASEDADMIATLAG